MTKDTQIESFEALQARHSDELAQANSYHRNKLEKAHLEAKANLERLSAQLFDEELDHLVDHLTREDLSRHRISYGHFQDSAIREVTGQFDRLRKVTPRGKRPVVILAEPDNRGRAKRVFAMVELVDLPRAEDWQQ